jgi:hypothetical protein
MLVKQLVGIGYTQLLELMEFLEMLTVSKTSYLKIQEKVSDTVHGIARDKMKQADEEKKIVLKCSEVWM